MEWLAVIPIGLMLSGATWYAYNFPKKTQAAGPCAFFGVLALWGFYAFEHAGRLTGREEMLKFVPVDVRDAAIAELPIEGDFASIFLPVLPALVFVLFLLWVSTLKAQRDRIYDE